MNNKDATKRIEESEKRLSYIISQVSAGIAQADLNGILIEVNDRFCDITGYQKEELLGMNVRALTHPDDFKRTVEYMAQAISEGKAFLEKKYIKKDGSVIWVSNSISVFTDTNGVRSFFAICIDITTTKEQEQKIQQLLLHEQQAKNVMHELFMQVPAVICVLRGPEHIYELANSRYMQVIGNRDIIEKPVRKALPELVGQGIIELLDDVYKTGNSFIGNEILINLEPVPGQIVAHYFNFIYQASRDAYGTIIGILVHAVDVTAHVEARKKIEESEEQFSTLANNIQNLAWIADGEGWIYWYNSRWYEYTGTVPAEMEGWGWKSVHDPEKLSSVLVQWQHSINTGQPFEMVFPLKGADGIFRPFLTRAHPIRNSEGKVVRWIGTNTDINEQKKTEELLEEKVIERTSELKEAYKTLQQKNSEIAITNKNLEEKNKELVLINKELETFTYISSHDLQEPLRKIKTFSSLIAEERKNLSEDAQDYLQRVLDAVERMQTLLKDLLSYSQAKSREDSLEKTDLYKIVSEVLSDFKETIRETNAIIETEGLVEANVIRFQFNQLMQNLIGNALKFTIPGQPPRISIKCSIGNAEKFNKAFLLPGINYCHISVRDNGIGFNPQYAERIFEVFQRLHEYDKYNGTGIGLAICKRIVENHNGVITATSTLGNGATFDIYLPHVMD